MKLCQYALNSEDRQELYLGVIVTAAPLAVVPALELIRLLPDDREDLVAEDAYDSLMALLIADDVYDSGAATLLREALDLYQKQVGNKKSKRLPRAIPGEELCLIAPLLYPRKLLLLAGNYAEHITEGGATLAKADQETPRFFMKPATTCVISPGEEVLIHPWNQAVDWEGELAVVIGRGGRDIPAAEALDHVFGYTIMNDISERKFKIWPRSETRDRDKFFDWLNGKWGDGYAPLGPWVVTSDEITDPQALEIRTTVNGELKQCCKTSQMIFSVARLIEFISSFVTLEAGDVISTGTVAGVGNTSGTYLKPGDQMSVSITGLGSLSNPVAAANAAKG